MSGCRRVGLYYFPTGYQIIDFFFLSCLMFRISCTITPHTTIPSHIAQLSIAPYCRQTQMDMHAYILWDVIYSTLSHCFIFTLPLSTTSILSIYISTYHHNTHISHKSRLLTFCFLVFVSPGGLHNLHMMVNLSAG